MKDAQAGEAVSGQVQLDIAMLKFAWVQTELTQTSTKVEILLGSRIPSRAAHHTPPQGALEFFFGVSLHLNFT